MFSREHAIGPLMNVVEGSSDCQNVRMAGKAVRTCRLVSAHGTINLVQDESKFIR